MKDKIIPCHSINGLVLGECAVDDLTFLLGPPEEVEISSVQKIAGDKYGGNTVLKYSSKGIFAVIEDEDGLVPNPKIDGIYVEPPFCGVSPEGLYLGMSKADGMEILGKNFCLKHENDPSFEYSMSERDSENFQVWFEDEKLIRMKVERPNYEIET